MIQITDKHNCCGCSACSSICPKHCITMQADMEGFLYPKVNDADCIDCGLCEKVCHELHPFEERKPQKVYAAINKDEEIRLKSSSGGIFYLLAEKTISEGGVVFGARFDEQWQVVIDYAETMEDVKTFMGSKYVQARMATAYADAKRFLVEGRKVLFTGTPCQIAGLLHFLPKEYDNLTTCDFICHGTPSPKVWDRYLREILKGANRAIKDVNFRNKDDGWKKFSFKMHYNEDNRQITLISFHQNNTYMRAFLSDLILRPSCYACKAKQCRSKADITIADFWGISDEHPEMDDDKGTSLVLVHTSKGESALNKSQTCFIETKLKDAVRSNRAIYRSAIVHPKRSYFFEQLDKTDNLMELIDLSTRPTIHQRIKAIIALPKRVILKILKSTRGG